MAKPFATFDVDGTIFKSSLAEKVTEACVEAGIFGAEAFNDVYANRRRWQINNNEGLYQAYLRRLVGTFIEQMAGVKVEQFEQVTEQMLREQSVRKFAFPRKLIKVLRSSHYLVAVSGSPNILVEPFLQDLDMDQTYGSEFCEEDGIFTGEATPVGDKAAILKSLVASGTALQAGSIATGDTISDVPMLEFADIPIMFNASRTLTNYGGEFGWLRINEVKDQITVLERDRESGLYTEIDTEEAVASIRSL